MTRINCVPVTDLSNKHLTGEYHEITRVFGLVRRAIERGETPESIKRRAPSTYVMGEGHVLFFYTRLMWVSWRYTELTDEMRNRGYEPNPLKSDQLIEGINHDDWFGLWNPTTAEIEISRQRIKERTK